ncbi:MAG: hypothetical protein QOI20_3269 [Acidimicrobiaceae bacterium]|jgi:hypothetical protein|nr:hypothetical protein [Acidimicrobiaceae bacterium]
MNRSLEEIQLEIDALSEQIDALKERQRKLSAERADALAVQKFSAMTPEERAAIARALNALKDAPTAE